MIHETAVLGKDVKLGNGVAIGPYTVIEGNVEIGDGCQIGPHCHLSGYTTLGAGTRVHHGAVIGDLPQDLGYKPGISYCRIGRNCTIREYVTIHRGTDEGSATEIGDDVMLMAFVHIAHNCRLAERVVIANASQMAGHVHIGARAFISTHVGVHQFVHIGRLAMISGMTILTQDVAPFCTAAPEHGGEHRIFGPNVVGLRRAGLDGEQRRQVRDILKLCFFSGLGKEAALAAIEGKYPDNALAAEFAAFVRASKRGLLPGIGRHHDGPAENAED